MRAGRKTMRRLDRRIRDYEATVARAKAGAAAAYTRPGSRKKR